MMADTDEVSRVAELRERLIKAGYKPVPVKNGEKRPHGFAWTGVARSGKLPAVSASALSTGVLCDGLRVIDIDIDDRDAADDVAVVARELLGTAPERIRGTSPRRMLIYRAAEGEPGKRSIVSAKLTNDDGKPSKVEVLGYGQQFVGFGTHPSGSEYEWTGQPLDLHTIGELAAVSEDLIGEFLVAIAEMVGVAPEPEVTRSAPLSDMPRADDGDLGEDEMLDLLACISPDADYQEWLTVLMAVHEVTGGSGRGLDIVDKWSARGSKYKGRKDLEAKWRSFRNTGVTGRSLAKAAADHGADLSEIARRHADFGPELSPEEMAKSREIADRLLANSVEKQKAESDKADAEIARLIHSIEKDETSGGADERFDLSDGDMRAPGLVGELADWICDWTDRPVRIHALAASLIIVGGLVARKVYSKTNPTSTSLYIAALTPSGVGKQHPQNAISMVLSSVAPGYHHILGGWARSMPKIVVDLQESASRVMLVDELADKLASVRGRNASNSESAITEALRSIWGINTGMFHPDGALTRAASPIHRPCLSLYGATTISDFSRSITTRDVTNGFLNRFLLFPRFNPVKIGVERDDVMSLPDRLHQRCTWLYSCLNTGNVQEIQAVSGDQIPEAILVPFSPDAASAHEHNKAYQQEMVTKSDEDDALALYGRYAEQIKRVALITACGRCCEDMKHARIEASDMEFAGHLVKWSTEQFVTIVRQEMVENQFQAQHNLVLGIIRKANGKEMLQRSITRKVAGRIPRRVFEEIIDNLVESGVITKRVVKPGTTGGRPTCAFRLAR